MPYERGGLQLPNFKLYYWSAQLRSAIFYFATETPPAWIKIEQLETKLKLNLYLYSACPKKLGKITKKTFLKNTIDIWYRAHQYMGSIPPISPFSPI